MSVDQHVLCQIGQVGVPVQDLDRAVGYYR